MGVTKSQRTAKIVNMFTRRMLRRKWWWWWCVYEQWTEFLSPTRLTLDIYVTCALFTMHVNRTWFFHSRLVARRQCFPCLSTKEGSLSLFPSFSSSSQILSWPASMKFFFFSSCTGSNLTFRNWGLTNTKIRIQNQN